MNLRLSLLPRGHRSASLVRLFAALAVTILTLAGCSGGGDEKAAGGDSAGSTSAAKASGTVTVFAAASLTESFEDLADDFAGVYPYALLQYNFAGSQALAAQIEQGAPAGVFASANQRQMDRVVEAGLIEGAPQVFARNVLQIVVPAGNPKGVTGLADLARPDLKVVLAAEEVPVGTYSQEALGKAGVQVEPVSLENDVKAVVTKVALGEADAGIVYATDVTAEAVAIEGVDIPEDQNVPATYMVGVAADAPNAAAAQAFVDFLLSEDGQAKLQEYGFLPAAA